MNKIIKGDCIKELAQLKAESIDLVFADPPFNIGYNYDTYEDNKSYREYQTFTRQWIECVYPIVKITGNFWVMIGDEYAAELKIIAQKIGFICRDWIVWNYSFGVNCRSKFTRSHAHIFHFVKDVKNHKFNGESVYVPSVRQLMGDKRANPKGKIPDDTWKFSRVAGTFKERQGFHGCQMPERILERIIKVSTDEGDKIVDPFSGSGTTSAVAKKLNRKSKAFDISEEYVEQGNKRLAAIKPGDEILGELEPPPYIPKKAKK